MRNNTSINPSSGFIADQVYWGIVNWIYPPHCIGCSNIGQYFCESCKSGIELIDGNVCPTCGVPINSATDRCSCAQKSPGDFILRSWAVYDGIIRRAIHQMKYENDIGLSYYFSKEMAKSMKTLLWTIELVIPVPLSQERLKERGYNQADLLARPLSKFLRKEYSNNSLRRIRNTTSQIDLRAEDRRNNVKDAFGVEGDKVFGKNILLIDDLATTCSTLSECSKVLLEAGARSVSAFTVARATLKTNIF